jgi:hypothetical protein
LAVVAFLPPSPRLPARPPDAPWTPPPTRLGLTARQWAVAAITVASCLLLTAGIAAVAGWTTLHRDPTAAELERAANRDVARRWSAWPAGRIFPGTLPYQPGGGPGETARRLGILPDTGCPDAVDAQIVPLLTANGCRAALRATYADALGGVVTTVAVVAFPDPSGADRAFRELQKASSGDGRLGPAVRAAAFPGTASAPFTDASRMNRTSTRAGPYLLLTASGLFDGRPATAITKPLPGDPFGVAPQLAAQIGRTLAARPLPSCGGADWRC